MRRRDACVAAVLLLGTTFAARARAGGGFPPRGSSADEASPALRARFGADVARSLLESPSPDDRLRGLERAAATHTPDALALLEHASTDSSGAARRDPRALLVAVRGLARWIDRPTARDLLASLIGAQMPLLRPVGVSTDPAADDADGAARILLAREQAAIALVSSGNTLAAEAVVDAARSGGPGQEPALAALALRPPAAPVLGGVTLTTPSMIAIAVQTGDLRAIDAIRGDLVASDPGLRAAALAALGSLGDARVVRAARDAEHDKDARVRVGAAEALARLGAPDAAAAVEALVTDDATRREGLRLADLVQSDGVIKAAAARAAASADPETRSLAVVALGRQTGEAATVALATLARDARLAGEAGAALARSPSLSAMHAIEALAGAPDTRRIAARAYFVRLSVRAERSPSLDALLRSMAVARDARDRAVGAQALVALGDLPLAQALDDADAGVRRAAAMGAPGWGQRAVIDLGTASTMLDRLGRERDAATREVLEAGLVGGDPQAAVPTARLLDLAFSADPCAPLAAYALARRGDDQTRAQIEALLASRDPVMRAHVARGLAESPLPDATGRLARAYEWETDAAVRRAIVGSLAARSVDAGAPARRDALELAASLDPDARVRAVARRALSGEPPPGGARTRDVAWIHAVAADRASLPPALAGALVGADGLAVPFVFDHDGEALVPGVAAGEGLVRLAPRFAPYESR